MTGSEYQELAMRTASEITNQRDRYLNGALGISGEAGEVTDIIKKWAFHGHELDLDELKKELGDVLWYVALLCSASGMTMDDVMETNINKLKHRYPNGFTYQDSINREENK